MVQLLKFFHIFQTSSWIQALTVLANDEIMAFMYCSERCIYFIHRLTINFKKAVSTVVIFTGKVPSPPRLLLMFLSNKTFFFP